jgi:hypothetical protein
MAFVIVAFLVLILAALAGAGFFMLRRKDGDDEGKRMARALTIRVALSVALFLIIMLAWAMGWIHPKGIPLNT